MSIEQKNTCLIITIKLFTKIREDVLTIIVILAIVAIVNLKGVLNVKKIIDSHTCNRYNWVGHNSVMDLKISR